MSGPFNSQGREAGVQPGHPPLPLGRKNGSPIILSSPTQREVSPALRNKEENFCFLKV